MFTPSEANPAIPKATYDPIAQIRSRAASAVDYLMDFKDDPDHQPVRGIPIDLASAMNAALNQENGWYHAGYALGAYMIDTWRSDRVLDDMYKQLDWLIIYADKQDPYREPPYYHETIVWLWLRFPEVIDAVPLKHLPDFIEGANRKLAA